MKYEKDRITATECREKLEEFIRTGTVKPDNDNKMIEEIQKERGSVYGEFEFQTICVGQIISSLINCAEENKRKPTNSQIGAFAYIAIKLSRYAVSPSHEDTLTDLMIYCKLIRQMELGDE